MPQFRRPLPALACALALLCAPAFAQEMPPPPSMQALLEASSPEDWRTPDPDDLLYIELAGGRAIVELAPQFAPEHVANLRALARGRFWDGLTFYRAQDNFVVQFGANVADGEPAKPLGEARAALPAEFERAADGLRFHRLPDADGWAPEVGFVDGFAAARDPAAGIAWMAHCYGVLGAGRDAAPDSSNGTELYVVIGQSPRQLDRNITQVGRVLQGMELLSALPRGSGPLGFYEDPAQAVPIRSIRLASQLPEAERTPLQVLRTDTPLFDAVVESRRNRRDGWYLRPAGHIDLCNVPVPVRTPPA
ncbi:peptidylprolyl isomerase [Luteimonas huabeiensis]|uniref:peptidylprolyl isomerase n=1 Tax=Luteimonas huabeiensis TaxID=1244513 RepID=UPI00046676A2|nr:peptidylprolyl isomerase [Luteimonas huabeiensis]